MANGWRFGARSEECLIGVHDDLVRVVRHAIKDSPPFDFGVHCGLRTIEEQRVLVKTGKSRTLDSRHLTGHALDLHPWISNSIPWGDWCYWVRLSRHIVQTAHQLGVPVRWGGEWSSIVDGPHYELCRQVYPA